jgi:hypothetical protein
MTQLAIQMGKWSDLGDHVLITGAASCRIQQACQRLCSAAALPVAASLWEAGIF